MPDLHWRSGTSSTGDLPYSSKKLTLKTDIVVAFFGFSESYNGPQGVSNYKAELSAFVEHTLK